MIVSQLRLKNFKLFENQKFDFRQLTLLTGTNSPGKSTVHNALASILQTQAPHIFPFEIIPNGEKGSLGSYRDIAHGRNTRRMFSIHRVTQYFENFLFGYIQKAISP
jgi:predicted ATPase